MPIDLSLDLPDVALPQIGGARPRRRELTPDEERSLLGSLGHAAMSGLETTGNVLDTVGSTARGFLAGKNPLRGVFDPNQRISGRQLLEHHGIVEPRSSGARSLACHDAIRNRDITHL